MELTEKNSESLSKKIDFITGEKIQAIELGKKVLETNQRWDDKATTYQEAQVEFQEFIDDFADFVVVFTILVHQVRMQVCHQAMMNLLSL